MPAAVIIVVVEDLSLLVETALDHLERQEGVPLLAQDPAQALDVRLVELPVARRRALRVDQALALEEADLGDGHVGELLLQERQDLPYREMGTAGHGLITPVPSAYASPAPGPAAAVCTGARNSKRNLPTCTSSPLERGALSMRWRLR